jgi:hypothetical protein
LWCADVSELREESDAVLLASAGGDLVDLRTISQHFSDVTPVSTDAGYEKRLLTTYPMLERQLWAAREAG